MTESTSMTEPICAEDELREIVGTPGGFVVSKELDHVDRFARAFIEHATLMIMATAGADGRADATPRGGEPGFVQVLDEKRIFIPERKGNKRADSMVNILANPHVGTLIMIPGREDTLRLNGRASITKDPELLQLGAVNGKMPGVGILVEVEEVFFHCAASLRRSRAWDPSRWPDASNVASLGEALKEQTPTDLEDETPEAINEGLEEWNKGALERT
jgi:PPOX class probable FMN-dependent enzyme